MGKLILLEPWEECIRQLHYTLLSCTDFDFWTKNAKKFVRPMLIQPKKSIVSREVLAAPTTLSPSHTTIPQQYWSAALRSYCNLSLPTMAAYNFTSNGWCLKPDANWIRVVPWSSFASLVNIYSIFIQTYSVLHKNNCLQNFGKQENIRGEVLQRNEGLNRYFLNFFRTDI